MYKMQSPDEGEMIKVWLWKDVHLGSTIASPELFPERMGI